MRHRQFRNGLFFPADVLADAARQATFEALEASEREAKAARRIAVHAPEAPPVEQLEALHARAETTERVARSLTHAAMRRAQ